MTNTDTTGSTGTTVGVVVESEPDERRVALVPKAVSTLVNAGVAVVVESGAGDAALLPDDTLHGGYVNVAERGGTHLVEQKSLVEARDALIEGMLADAARIAQGAVLPALGDGAACDFCQARGLCRKDFWSAA